MRTDHPRPARRREGHPGLPHRRAASASPPSPPATSSAPTSRTRPSSASRSRTSSPSGGYVPDEVTNAIVARPAAEDDAAQASCSTATPARWPRSRRSTPCWPTDGHALDAVLELTVDEDAVVAAPAQARRDRGPRRRHRGGHPRAPGHLPPRDRPARRASTPSAACCVQVDGMGEVDEVTARIEQALRRSSAAPDVRPVPHRDQDPRADRPHARGRVWWSGGPSQLLAQTRPSRHDDQRARRAGRGAHPRQRRARPSFLGYHGFTGTPVHLGQRRGRARHPGLAGAAEGDLLSIDCGADRRRLARRRRDLASSSAAVSAGRAEDLALIDATEDSMWAGIAALAVGQPLYAVGAAVEDSITAAGERARPRVRHRRGLRRPRHRHRDAPGPAGAELPGPRPWPHRAAGVTVAIEPMVTLGSAETRVLGDEWTVVTTDGSRAAHWEHSVAVTDQGHLGAHRPRRGQGAAGSRRRGIRPAVLTPSRDARQRRDSARYTEAGRDVVVEAEDVVRGRIRA